MSAPAPTSTMRQIHVIDMLGFGLSDKPAEFHYSVAASADQWVALAQAKALTAVDVLAHDYGNTVAQELLARQLEGRLPFRLRSIAFLNGGLFPEATYPLLLQTMLRARYTTQASTIAVVNRGVGGETAQSINGQGGIVRLPGVLAADRPDLLLLLEGVNDLSSGNPTTIQPMIDALRLMVRQGRNSGAQVVLATLLPERAGPGTPQARNGALPLINQANDQIRRAAVLEGATLIDLFQGLGGTPDPWIGSDNLHPNDTGYQKIAGLFFDLVRTQFEVTPTLTLTAGPR